MEWLELGELCEIKSGGTPLRRKKEYWTNGDIPWVKISDIKDKYVDRTEEYITKEGFENSSVKMLSKGSLIYTIFATIGKVGILNIDATTNQAIVGLEIIREDYIKRDYLFYFLKSIENEIKSKARGVAQNNINIGILKGIQIPVPSMDIQKKIVEVLDEAQKLIDNRKKQIALLDDLIESTFYEMFGDPIKNNKGWVVKKLNDESVCIVPARDKPKSFTGEIPWITINDMEQSGFTFISKEGLGLTEGEISEVKREVLPVGCVLMSCVGNLGITSINSVELVINQQIHAFKCSSELNNQYLKHYIPKRKDYLEKVSNSTTVKYINKTKCENIPLLLPPLSLQDEFAERVELIESQKSLMEESLQLLEDNYNNLMQRTFKGELF